MSVIRIQFILVILVMAAILSSCASSATHPQAATAKNASDAETPWVSSSFQHVSMVDNPYYASVTTPPDPNRPHPPSILRAQQHSGVANNPPRTTKRYGVEVTKDTLDTTTKTQDQDAKSQITTVSSSSTATTTSEPTLINQLLDKGDYASAWKLALDNFKSGSDPDQDVFWSTFEKDPIMTETLEATVRPNGTNSLSALGGGSTISLKYKDSADPSAKAAIKPDQDLRQTMYRSEIAYYRLCQILGCSYATPITRPVKWKKRDFNALYKKSSSSKNKGYSAKFDHLIWAKEDSDKFLYAAYKEWISPITLFPIEVTSAWIPYLRPNAHRYPKLETFFRNILTQSRKGKTRDLKKLIQYSESLSAQDIFRQISDMTLIDFITNNWDRYAGTKENYGANCHFHPGGIIAIDNGAAFPPWHSPRVVDRLHNVQVFSRDHVLKLRMLDPDKLFEHLFPNPTYEEEKSRARFKERRKQALDYIDVLIRKYGEDRVLTL